MNLSDFFLLMISIEMYNSNTYLELKSDNKNETICCFQSQKYTIHLTKYEHSEIYVTKNFKSFDELNFISCNQIVYISSWQIVPNQFLILNQNLNFTGLTIDSLDTILAIKLYHVKGLFCKFFLYTQKISHKEVLKKVI